MALIVAIARAPKASSAGGVLPSTRISLNRPKSRKMPPSGNSPSMSSNKRVEAFKFALAIEQNVPMSPLEHGPINGFAWAERGLGYSLVGATAPEAPNPIANQVHRQISGVI